MVFSTICGTLKTKKKGPGAVFKVFLDLLGHFEVQRARNFWFGMCHKTVGLYHVLSVSVVPSVSVESAMESNDVLMTCFCAVSFERHDVKSQDHCSKKPPLAATQAFSLRTQALPIFLEHLTAACPRSVIHASQKCPHFCGIGSSRMLNELYFELVPQKEVRGRGVW